MNNYDIKIYNESSSYRSIIVSNIFIRNFVEKLHFINLCEKQNIISYKPWIGIINSLNCNKTYINHYVSMNMNLLITTPNIIVENVPTCLISNDSILYLEPDLVYTASINNSKYYFQVITLYLLYISTFIISIHFIKKI